MHWQLAANHTESSTPMSNEVNTVDNTDEFRRLSDTEIEHLILKISKQIGGIDTGKDRLHY